MRTPGAKPASYTMTDYPTVEADIIIAGGEHFRVCCLSKLNNICDQVVRPAALSQVALPPPTHLYVS